MDRAFLAIQEAGDSPGAGDKVWAPVDMAPGALWSLLLLLGLLLLRLWPPCRTLQGLSLSDGRRRSDAISPAPGGFGIWAALPPLGGHTLRFWGGL